jgi:membrane associated rhomboid family serine protease
MFIIVFSISLLLLFLPNFAATLMASSQNIPSAFTSVFVHKDFTHLGTNIILALTALLLYSPSTAISGKRNGTFIVLAIWISTILANLAYLNTAPYSRIGGASGLVSAFLGGAMTIAYLNARTEPVPRTKAVQFFLGTLLLVVFIVLNLNVDADASMAVHLSSFFNTVVLMLAKHFLSSFFSKKD